MPSRYIRNFLPVLDLVKNLLVTTKAMTSKPGLHFNCNKKVNVLKTIFSLIHNKNILNNQSFLVHVAGIGI
jgi:hypothetical protein